MSALQLDQLLRELRLKVRREVALELERSGLWVGNNVYAESLHARQIQGQAMADDLVVRHLGGDDYWWLDASRVFGGQTKRFRTSLPSKLSFGFDLGSGMSGGPANQRRASSCALFNLGITMFDSLCDRAPEGRQQLSKFVHPDSLRGLCMDAKAIERLKTQAKAIKNFELRCVLKIVAGFFSDIRELAEPAVQLVGSPLEDLILRAYRAQMICSNWREGISTPEVVEAVRQKSTLPFQVMFRIGCLRDDVPPSSDKIASSIGDIFGLLDDLVDLPKDLQRGCANRFLFEIENDRCEGLSASTYETALALLTKGYISDGARRLSGSMQDALNGFDTSSGLRLSVLVYARSWLGQTHEEN